MRRGDTTRPGAQRPAGEPPPAPGRRDWLIALILLTFCAVTYYRAPVQQLLDWRFSTAVSHALLHEGSFSVPRQLLERQEYQLLEVEGRAYHSSARRCSAPRRAPTGRTPGRCSSWRWACTAFWRRPRAGAG